MHAICTRALGRISALCLGLLLSGCPADDEPVTDMGLSADMTLADATPDRGVETKDMGPGDAAPDVEPPDAAPDAEPDARPSAQRARAPELCVGCGAAASPRFRLIEHGLTPAPQGPSQTATSPRFRLILEP